MARAKKVPSPFPDGRGSKVNPDVAKAEQGEGGARESDYSGKPNIPAVDRGTRDAKLIDAGRPVPRRKRK
jgi:hypothetical protein